MARKKVATLDGLAELLTLSEAAEASGYTELTIRREIKAGRLKAFIPGGRDPLRTGPGHGYRIRRDDLRAWYFGS